VGRLPVQIRTRKVEEKAPPRGSLTLQKAKGHKVAKRGRKLENFGNANIKIDSRAAARGKKAKERGTPLKEKRGVEPSGLTASVRGRREVLPLNGRELLLLKAKKEKGVGVWYQREKEVRSKNSSYSIKHQ